jgi:hypothetical protein
MITKRIKELETAKARLAQLEKSLAADLQTELASLPANYGFASVRAFVAAVTSAKSSGGRRKAKSAIRKVRKAPAVGRKRRRRAVITDAIRTEVKKLTESGKTGAEIARAVRISLPSVQNIKKAFGLVKSRK